MTHPTNSLLLTRSVKVAVVGCGGNGSQVLNRLARLDRAIRECGHPGGLEVTAYDPDNVSVANIGRQLFSPADVGLPKATVLVHRLNCFFGLDWKARVEIFKEVSHLDDSPDRVDLLITCVDTAKARREIHYAITSKARASPLYWLDLGNRQNDGQVVLGQPVAYTQEVGYRKEEKNTLAHPMNPRRLKTVTEIFPELLDPNLQEDNTPSCSLAEALDKQELFINDHIVSWAMQTLWFLFRRGRIEHHAYFINLESGSVNALPVPEAS